MLDNLQTVLQSGMGQLDDRFREPGIRGTGSVFVDSSFEFV